MPQPTPNSTELRRLLRGVKLRVTAVRLAVLRVLAGSPEALDAQQVFARLDRSATDRVTVYRTLGTLVEAGLAHRVDPGDRVFRFSLTDHSACTPQRHAHEHPHFVCDACGTVECLDDAEVIVQPMKARPARARRTTPRIDRRAVTLHGTCGKCETTSTRRTRRQR